MMLNRKVKSERFRQSIFACSANQKALQPEGLVRKTRHLLICAEILYHLGVVGLKCLFGMSRQNRLEN